MLAIYIIWNLSHHTYIIRTYVHAYIQIGVEVHVVRDLVFSFKIFLHELLPNALLLHPTNKNMTHVINLSRNHCREMFLKASSTLEFITNKNHFTPF